MSMDLNATRAADLMTRNVVTAHPDETLRTTAVRMAEGRIHCLVITDRTDGHLIGILTAKDLTQPMLVEAPELLDEMRVEDVMTRPAICVRVGMSVSDCVRQMRFCGVRAAPVVECETVVGLLSFTDVLRAIAQAGTTAPAPEPLPPVTPVSEATPAPVADPSPTPAS